MHRPAPKHWALVATGVLVVSTLAFSVNGMLADSPAASGDTDALAATGARARDGHDGHDGHDHPSAGTGAASGDLIAPHGLDASLDIEPSHTPPFPLETGVLPTRSDALDFPNRFSRFIAKGTEGLDELAREGHLSGRGTTESPYVLERFYVDGDLTIQSTDRAIILREGYVTGQLSLNYIGEQVYVHHVYAKDLRVNENVRRSGDNTGGLWHDNAFGFVGQIRHFTGEFRDNTIGPKPQGVVADYLSDTGTASLPEGIVFNFDGFHGADVHHNTFIGQVDIKLHGHNHGDCLLCPIHDHADDREYPATQQENGIDTTISEDLGFRSRHSVRYHSLLFRDNTIEVPDGFALRYNDRNHAGDDQTANSEPNGFLEDPHVHYQQISLRGNHLKGGPLVVEIFNAADDNHVTANQGVLRITGNTIEIPYTTSTQRNAGAKVGMDLLRADGIQMRIDDNKVLFHETGDDLPAKTLRSVVEVPPPLIGFRLDQFSDGHLLFVGNHVNMGDTGVLAKRLDATVFWDLQGNDLQTEKPYRAEDSATAPGETASTDEEEGA